MRAGRPPTQPENRGEQADSRDTTGQTLNSSTDCAKTILHILSLRGLKTMLPSLCIVFSQCFFLFNKHDLLTLLTFILHSLTSQLEQSSQSSSHFISAFVWLTLTSKQARFLHRIVAKLIRKGHSCVWNQASWWCHGFKSGCAFQIWAGSKRQGK